MNIYLLIVVAGFLLKSVVAYYAVTVESSSQRPELRQALIVGALVICSFSIPHFFLLADSALATPFGLPRHFILRWYLLHSLAATAAGIYCVLAAFYPKYLGGRGSRRALQILGVLIVATGLYFFAVTDTVISSQWLTKQSLSIELGRDSDDGYLIFTRVFGVVFFSGLLISFVHRYRLSTDHRSQIINLYAIIALIMSVIACTIALFSSHPAVFAVKGVFFTVVVFLACSDRKIMDARSVAVVTKEAKANRKLQSVFHQYANNKVSHKEAMRAFERELVEYKLSKVSQFHGEEGSPLPMLAKEMGLGLSTVYEILKRLGIERP